MNQINIGHITIKDDSPFFLIAGPCSIESEELVMNVASTIKEITSDLEIPFIFKASFDKANRTSIHSYRGPGIDEGLRILQKVKDELDLPVITDIHLPEQAAKVAEVADVIQIPAFLCRQTDLLIAAAQTGKPLNIKKAQFMAPWDMENVLKKCIDSGNDQVMLCERGTSFGYNNLVVDMPGIIEMKKFGQPIVFDATHSVQKPGGKGDATGGNREYVEYLARAAVAIGIDGLFMEVHPDPDSALSDGPNMVPLDKLEDILVTLKTIDDTVKGNAN
ncbi:2-dehydro-3-deoxyphosphooctonate aldolase (KDO 8-P synthase) [Gracilibacillus halotolerans]|uniref:2-dehydro-3-deoxyphosphooctonate aldolase n=1 Tax=Gracilibacillus halotolerans TaxID=74386 RepID=A0A841RI06_9BACI|nr:3-deoxy-8-phosphooctulonate synthase [Gracilibacillus halotolerans]MBB6512291.1 2-dehydro-3-deoxyphosphooctonate aldolase (KDO 8-P synthase) [Gracilibacillus halotolerans]